jgi:hypothetical protein
MIKSLLLTHIKNAGIRTGVLSAYYDLSGANGQIDKDLYFKLTSGHTTDVFDTYVIYNQLFSTGSQLVVNSQDTDFALEGDLLFSVDNSPATVTTSSSSITGGTLEGRSSLRVGKAQTGDAWTCFLDFSGNDICLKNPGSNQVLFSTMKDPFSLSGFNVGINGSNRLYCEHISGKKGLHYHRVVETLPVHLKSLNVMSVAKDEDSIELSLHKYEEETESIRVSSPFFSKSEEMLVGGMSKGTSYSHFYTGYSGAINTFLLFDDYVTETSRNTIADSFFVSGHKSAGFVTGESINKEVTGVQVFNVLSGTGITGYQLTGTGSYQNEAGEQVTLYGLSGVTGKIFQDVLVDSTGPRDIISITGFYSGESFIEDTFYVKKSRSVGGKIKFEVPLATREVYEIYSHDFTAKLAHQAEKNLYNFGTFTNTDGRDVQVTAMQVKNDNFSYSEIDTQPFIQFFHNGILTQEVSGLYSVDDIWENEGNVLKEVGDNLGIFRGGYFIHDNAAGQKGSKNKDSRLENNSYYLVLNHQDNMFVGGGEPGDWRGRDFGLFDIASGATLTGEYSGIVKHYTGDYLDKDIYYRGQKLLMDHHFVEAGAQVANQHNPSVKPDVDKMNGEFGLAAGAREPLLFAPRASNTFSRITGEVEEGSDALSEIEVNNVFFEQVWRNGIRQIPGIDYARSPGNSLISGTNSPSYVNDSFNFVFSNDIIDISVDDEGESKNNKIFSLNTTEQKTNMFEKTN